MLFTRPSALGMSDPLMELQFIESKNSPVSSKLGDEGVKKDKGKEIRGDITLRFSYLKHMLGSFSTLSLFLSLSFCCALLFLTIYGYMGGNAKIA